MVVNRKFSREEKGKHLATESFPSNCIGNMFGRDQNDVDSIKRFFGVSPDHIFDEDSELTQSMISAYHKIQAIFPPKGGSMIYAIPSNSQMPLEHINEDLIGDRHHGCDIEAMSVSSPSKQASTSWSKKRVPITKNYRCAGRSGYRPKLVFLRRENLVVNHALKSQLAKGEEFRFFHRSSLASMTVKVARPSVSSYGPENLCFDPSFYAMGDDEPIIDTEKMTVVLDHDTEDKHESSDNDSCLSVKKLQLTSLAEQTSNDQVMDMVSFTTLGGMEKRKKQSRRHIGPKGVNLIPPHSRKDNKTGKRKGVGRRLASKIIGRNGRIMTYMPTRMVTPCKRVRQPIAIELVIDTTLVQAFKRRKWLLGSG